MTTISVQKSIPESLNQTCAVLTWPGMQVGDVGTAVELANYADRSVQVTGDFGVGGNVRIEGSLDGSTFAPLSDPQGNTLDIAAAKIEAITELVRYIRPHVTNGDGSTAVTITMLCKGS